MQIAINEFLDTLSCEATDQQVAQIAVYAEMLWEANSRVNLTRHVDLDSFLSRDLLDSVMISRQIQSGEVVLDVGSGGGVPGILIAILRPDVSVALAESIRKKADILTEFVTKIDLPVTVYNERAEAVTGRSKCDVLTVRAVAPVAKLCTVFKGRWRRVDRMLALKGPNWEQEVESARTELAKAKVNATCVEEYSSGDDQPTSVILQLSRA